MVILIGSQKGGTGKSTIATNLAAMMANDGKDVILLDADPQMTSSRWAARRAEREIAVPLVHCVQRSDENIRPTVIDLANRYEHIIIDTAGQDGVEFRSALTVAHRVYLPLRASQADLETMANVDEVLNSVRALRLDGGPTATAVLSIAPTHYRNSETMEAREFLSEFTNLYLTGNVIRDRRVYRDAMLEGLGVCEMGNDQAKQEISDLYREVML